MINFRSAKLQDVKQIQEIEKEYYEGFNCPEETLRYWIENLADNFLVAESNNKIIGFIFFEYLDEIKVIPFVHELEHKKDGQYVYTSEAGVLNEFYNSSILQKLFEKLLEKSKKDGCKMIICPNYFVDDHFIWIRKV